jgi:hypothetical protein
MSMTAIEVESGTNFDMERYERVSLTELKSGDIIRIPSVLNDGEVLAWSYRGYTVSHVEERAPGVFFVWRDRSAFPPKTTYDTFMMLCGQYGSAGVLRLKRTPAVDEAPRRVDLVVVIGDDDREIYFPACTTNDSACVWPIVDEHKDTAKTVGQYSRPVFGPVQCRTCGASL